MSDTNTLAVCDTKIEEATMEKGQEMSDAEQWIPAHGSERLALALALGELGQSLAVYRSERLAVERPGWQFRHEERMRDRRNASHSDLRELEAERVAGHDETQLAQCRHACDTCGKVGRCSPGCDAERDVTTWSTCLADSWGGRPIFRMI